VEKVFPVSYEHTNKNLHKDINKQNAENASKTVSYISADYNVPKQTNEQRHKHLHQDIFDPA
jgi:hypothetical protein